MPKWIVRLILALGLVALLTGCLGNDSEDTSGKTSGTSSASQQKPDPKDTSDAPAKSEDSFEDGDYTGIIGEKTEITDEGIADRYRKATHQYLLGFTETDTMQVFVLVNAKDQVVGAVIPENDVELGTSHAILKFDNRGHICSRMYCSKFDEGSKVPFEWSGARYFHPDQETETVFKR